MAKVQRPNDLLVQTFARLHAVALGTSCGIVCSLIVFGATAILLIKGGNEIGPNLGLLSQFYIGYSVTWAGSVIGAGYGFLTGFIAGWTIAFVRNLTITAYLHAIRLRTHLGSDHFLDRFDS